MTKEDFMEQWGVQGMSLGNQRLANAAWDDATKAKRELCAKLCEDSNVFDYDDPGGFFANLIRGQDC